MKRIILASASPRRVELLRSMGIEFEVVPSRIDELHDERLSARELCENNAQRKALDIAQNHRDALVIGADTLVTLDGRLYGKPKDLTEAERMLSELSGRTHEVITGVCLVHKALRRQSVFSDSTHVEFRTLSSREIRAYLELVPVLDKAGAYGIQDRGEMLVANVSGSLNNVIGLPTERLAEEFERWQIPYNKRSR